MGEQDLVVASTTDTAEAIEAALTHGIEETPAEEAVETPAKKEADKTVEAGAADDKAAGEKKDDKAVEGKGDEKKNDAKVETKAADDKKREPKPKRDDFKTDDEYADALIGWGATKRIGKLTAQKTAAEQATEAEKKRADEATAETERLRRENDELKAAKPAKEAAADKVVEKPAPKAEDFETHEGWLSALSKHEAEVAVAKQLADVKAKSDADAQAAEMETLQKRFIERQGVARERYPDLDDVMQVKGKDLQLNGVQQYVMLNSEIGNEIGRYLALHPDESNRIFAMDGPDAIRAMGRIEERVQTEVDGLRKAAVDAAGGVNDEDEDALEEEPAAPARKAIPATRAGEPIAPVNAGRSAGQRKQLHEIEDQREFNKRRNEEEAARRRRH